MTTTWRPLLQNPQGPLRTATRSLPLQTSVLRMCGRIRRVMRRSLSTVTAVMLFP